MGQSAVLEVAKVISLRFSSFLDFKLTLFRIQAQVQTFCFKRTLYFPPPAPKWILLLKAELLGLAMSRITLLCCVRASAAIRTIHPFSRLFSPPLSWPLPPTLNPLHLKIPVTCLLPTSKKRVKPRRSKSFIRRSTELSDL